MNKNLLRTISLLTTCILPFTASSKTSKQEKLDFLILNGTNDRATLVQYIDFPEHIPTDQYGRFDITKSREMADTIDWKRNIDAVRQYCNALEKNPKDDQPLDVFIQKVSDGDEKTKTFAEKMKSTIKEACIQSNQSVKGKTSYGDGTVNSILFTIGLFTTLGYASSQKPDGRTSLYTLAGLFCVMLSFIPFLPCKVNEYTVKGNFIKTQQAQYKKYVDDQLSNRLTELFPLQKVDSSVKMVPPATQLQHEQ